ncbi:hypothetical protein GCM10023403_26290 [Pseudonocardia benzenivorans]|nr:hypothetical protein PSD17_62150 [Pseudonocardia sp. D17]
MRARRPGCPRVEQAVGLVLHVLEPDEEMEILGHLPTCPDCRAAAREAGATLGVLGASVDQVDPPARLRAAILDAAVRTPQQPSASPVRPTGSVAPAEPTVPARPAEPARPAGFTRPTVPGATGAGPGDDRPPAVPGHGGPPRRSGPRRAPRARTRRLVAAALVLVVALGLGGLVARTVQLQQQRDEQIARTQTIFDMVSRFDSPGTRHAWLTEAPGATPVAAVMVSGPTRQIVTVGLPANSAATDTYVLWGMGAGPPQAVGTFDVGSVESGPHDIGSGPGASYAGYAISIEPGRTAPASPSKVVASGQVEI